MSHTDLILVITILGLSSTIGVYVIIRIVKQNTATPENLLIRRGEIELGNYNEPSQPLEVYNPRGLESLHSEQIICSPLERFSPITVIEGLNSDPFSEVEGLNFIDEQSLELDSLNLQPVYYQDLYISSCLENESSSDIILFILIILFWVWFFKKF